MFQRLKSTLQRNSTNDALVQLNTTFADDENSSAAQQAMKEIADAKAQAGINKFKKAYTDLRELTQLIENKNRSKVKPIFRIREISMAQLVEVDNQIKQITSKKEAAEKAYLDAVTEYESQRIKNVLLKTSQHAARSTERLRVSGKS